MSEPKEKEDTMNIPQENEVFYVLLEGHQNCLELGITNAPVDNEVLWCQARRIINKGYRRRTPNAKNNEG